MKTILLLFIGFLLHKVAIEVITYKHEYAYKHCVESADYSNIEKTPDDQCQYTYDNNTIEEIVLYQPNIWSDLYQNYE